MTDCPDLSKSSVNDLVRDLGADPVETRECAEKELKRRVLEQPGLEGELTILLPQIRDPEVLARLNEVLHLCRYYLRVCQVIAIPDEGWWEDDVQFKFGTGAKDVEVQTPDYHLQAGLWRKFGPSGVQIYNSVQHGKRLDCGEVIEHQLYIDAVGFGSSIGKFRRRCIDKQSYILWPTFQRKHIRFQFKLELQTYCSSTPPWATPC